MKLISTAEAAKRLGVHITRVQVLIREGRLPAQKVGPNYVVREGDLRLVADRKPGRPAKTARRKRGLGGEVAKSAYAAAENAPPSKKKNNLQK